MISHWDIRFLSLAATAAGWSKDPSTKTACVIVRPDRSVASMGYNGFPRSLPDRVELLHDRAAKYDRVIHGEMNALLHCRDPMPFGPGYTAYTIFPPCVRCMVHLIQAGITRVCCTSGTEDQHSRWNVKDTVELAREANVAFEAYHGDIHV